MKKIQHICLLGLLAAALLLSACGTAADWQQVAPLGSVEQFRGEVVTLGLARPDLGYTLVSGYQIEGLVIAETRLYNSAGTLVETRAPHLGDKGVLISETDGTSVIWVMEIRETPTP